MFVDDEAVKRLLGQGYLSWLNAIVSVLGARVLGSGAAFLGNILVARHLEPAGYGQFYLLFTIMTVVAGLTGPGLDTSLVRFASKHLHTDREASFAYFTVMFYMKCVVFVTTMLLGVIAAKPLLRLLFSSDEVTSVTVAAVTLAFFGGAAVSMWGFAQSYFQSRQQFGRYAGFEFFSSTLRLGLVVLLILLDVRRIWAYLAVYVAAPTAMWGVSWLLLPRRVFTADATMAVTRELLAFAKWVLLATFFTTLTQRLDLLLLGMFRLPQETLGCYGAAVSLVLLGELVLLTFYNVLLPKASALKNASDLRRFIGSFRVPSLFFCLGMSLLMPFAETLRHLFFGEKYVGTELYFLILLTGIIVSLGCAPAVTSLYSLGRSHLIAAFEGGRFVCTLALGLYIVPRYGAVGMAWVVTGTRAVMSALMYLVAHQEVKRLTVAEYMGGDG
ncbi:MAG TPA: oligosaccharide flippase family protein [Candidatus Hydrogenedentes bacterium]|nr:oligosaccharide flippase family protein [Candidatus Hydrogenedentota bacterium]HNT86414.1 oligosaccharide flippase family protein [Candidatus Hydrogenedentota bacterium]